MTTPQNQNAAGFGKTARVAARFLFGLGLWFSFVKLPATSFRDSVPQSWEAVLSFAAAHQLQWGRDIVFTFGPLGFLTSDYYWGHLFGPILIWAFGFAAVLAWVIVRLSSRIPLVVCVALFLLLPLLTVPSCSDLAFDPVIFLSITLLGIRSLPSERPCVGRAVATGFVFGLLSLIKFTFFIYVAFALAVIALSNWGNRRWGSTGNLAAAFFTSVLSAWLFSGQSPFYLPHYFTQGWELASGYSAAMAVRSIGLDVVFGVSLLICVAALVLAHWFRAPVWWKQTDRAAIVAAGVFLAWKEGFVRPDIHVVVFFLYSFFITAMLPALFRSGTGVATSEKTAFATESTPGTPTLLSAPRKERPPLLLAIIATLVLALTPFVMERKPVLTAALAGFVSKYSDTFTAVSAPLKFKAQLELELEAMRQQISLPGIKAAAGDGRVAVLNFDQQAAILNGLNYVPHPVFQSYSAFTPELQRLNANFFNSSNAPEYVLWRAGTIQNNAELRDGRFPTLEDGEVVLRILSSWSPVLEEGAFILWKRNSDQGKYSLADERTVAGALDEWIPLPEGPTWLTIDLRQSWLGSIQSFLWSCPEARMEVRLARGRTLRYRLPPGNARSGFLVNPLLQTREDLLGLNAREHVTAIRVYCANKRFYRPRINCVTRTISGIPALEAKPEQPRTYNDQSTNANGRKSLLRIPGK